MSPPSPARPSFKPDKHQRVRAPWLSEYGREQTRPPRALRVWATLASTGRDGYHKLIDHDLDLAERLAAGVVQRDRAVSGPVRIGVG
jgi:glutamate/tyrosine decarboxylase-like PLP-dependent enzyme